MKNYIVLTLLGLFAQLSFCQDKLHDKEAVIAAAIAELDYASASGDIAAFVQENGISGHYTFLYTIRNKGEVVTLRILSSESASIPKQNLLKDFLKDRKFGFTMVKGPHFQFQYDFKFSNS